MRIEKAEFSFRSSCTGFTLTELLVTISIISLLLAILVPSVSTARKQAKMILKAGNQGQIITSVSVYAADNDGHYPESVATIGFGNNWNWSDPRKLVGNKTRSPRLYRSMGSYLRSYIPEAKIMYCPNSPHKYKYLQQAWDAKEQWDNPETSFPTDPVGGTYCFYWNYVGYLGGDRITFQGPKGTEGGRNQSKLMISDYFGFDNWQSPDCWSSCERLRKGFVIDETWLLSSYWALGKSRIGENQIEIFNNVELTAGYSDGHVEKYNPRDTAAMRISLTSDGKTPYPYGMGSGIFFIPLNALK